MGKNMNHGYLHSRKQQGVASLLRISSQGFMKYICMKTGITSVLLKGSVGAYDISCYISDHMIEDFFKECEKNSG